MRTKVLEVRQPERPAGLAGAAIDRPAAGDERADWALDIRGWAVGRESPVTAVEGVHEGTLLWRVPLLVDRPRVAASVPEAHGDTIGFFATHSLLVLPPRGEVEVRAVLEDGTRSPFGTVTAERSALRTGYAPRRQPILITTFGRSGSMLLMRLLASHPDVLAYKPYRFEQRVASYWIDLLLTLSEPNTYLRGIVPDRDVDDRTWWLGANATMPWPLRDQRLQDWLGGEAIEDLAATCQERIDATYERIAAETGAGQERFFPEKSNLRVSNIAAELYPDGREVFLVRDFRDMVASVFAYDRKRGVAGFGRASADSDVEYVERLGGWVQSLARAWQRRRERSHLVRYEDLVRDPERSLSALLGYLGVDSSAATARSMVERLSEDIPELREHHTSESPQSSIGRWRTDLDAEVAAVGERVFGPALELFGY
jgi:hypothetical protein